MSGPVPVSLYASNGGSVSSSAISLPPLARTLNPTSSDIRGPNGLLNIGQIWVNTVSGNSFILSDLNSVSGVVVATWSPLGQTGGALNTLTGSTGGAITPNAGNINLTTSDDLYSFIGSSNNLVLTTGSGGYPTTPFVVGPVGSAGYQTIQSAIDAAHAVGGGTIAIQRGTYTEDLTLRPYCSLYCATGNCDPNDVAIIGTHTPPIELSVISFGLINFYSSSGAIFKSNEAGQCYLISFTCNWVLTQPGWIFDMPNWTGPLSPLMPVGTPGVAVDNCGDLSTADSGFLNNPNGGMTLNIIDSYIGSQQGALGTKTLITSGIAQFSLCDIFCPVNVTGNSQSGADSNFFEACDFHDCSLTFSGDSTGYVSSVAFDGLSGISAITMSSSGDWYFTAGSIDTSFSPAIAGSGVGVLSLGGISFVNNKTIANTVNLRTLPTYQVFPPYSTYAANATIKQCSGSYSTNTATLTLPVSTNLTNGDLFEFVCTTADVMTVKCVGAQKIRIGESISTAAGTATSSAIGNSLVLRYNATDGFFYATTVIGTWTLA